MDAGLTSTIGGAVVGVPIQAYELCIFASAVTYAGGSQPWAPAACTGPIA